MRISRSSILALLESHTVSPDKSKAEGPQGGGPGRLELEAVIKGTEW